jgi:hypothetical protein
MQYMQYTPTLFIGTRCDKDIQCSGENHGRAEEIITALALHSAHPCNTEDVRRKQRTVETQVLFYSIQYVYILSPIALYLKILKS